MPTIMPESVTTVRDLRDVSKAQLKDWLLGQGEMPYRAEQILRWVYGRGATDFSTMQNVPLALRARLAASFSLAALEPMLVSEGADGTRKLLFGLSDGARVETVLIPDRERLTVCVSSQAGCGMGCAFCATAGLGLVRNLRTSEILGQVAAAMAAAAPARPTNVVFMGMGEPLANYESLLAALEALTASWGYAFSSRRVTVSTVGLVPGIQRLARDSSVNIAISLTATTDSVRDRLVPVNRRYPLATLLQACRDLPLPGRKRLFFEYVLLDGVNDSDEDAHRLVRLLRGIPAKVNLIVFNPYPGASFTPSPRQRTLRFQEIVRAPGLQTNLRESRGQDIQAACGQLAAEAA